MAGEVIARTLGPPFERSRCLCFFVAFRTSGVNIAPLERGRRPHGNRAVWVGGDEGKVEAVTGRRSFFVRG